VSSVSWTVSTVLTCAIGIDLYGVFDESIDYFSDNF